MTRKTPPAGHRWVQPQDERDTRRPERARSHGDFTDDLDELTPRPTDITAIQAWIHADNVAKRNANTLLEISNSAGVGMTVGDDVKGLTTRVAAHDKKLKWWQALIMAAITAAGTSLIGVAKGLYEKGSHEGTMETRIRQLELQAERNYNTIDKLRDEIHEITIRSNK